MNLRTIDETQAFNMLDLFTYFGGIIGLFLGMSIMSLGEVVHQIRIEIKKYKRRKLLEKQAEEVVEANKQQQQNEKVRVSPPPSAERKEEKLEATYLSNGEMVVKKLKNWSAYS